MAKRSATAFLPTDKLMDAAAQRLAELQNFIKRHLRPRPSTGKSPTPGLRVQAHKNAYQYYIISQPGDSHGKYLPMAQISKAKAIAQQKYDEALDETLRKQIQQISNFIEKYNPDAVQQAFVSLHPGRQLLVTPAILPQEQFVAQWLAKPYTGLPFSEGAPEYNASNGTRVRSKSEVIIADALTRGGIPFRYEQALTLECCTKSSRGPREVTLHPDFTCLNPRTRSEFIWEHFGLMSDPDYAHNAILKITEYAASGYVLGKNLIATFEDSETPLSTKLVQTYIEEYLK